MNKSFSFLLVSCEIAFRDKLAIVVKMTTLHSGSLGSGVDEERSRTYEHRHFERILRTLARPVSMSGSGSVYNIPPAFDCGHWALFLPAPAGGGPKLLNCPGPDFGGVSSGLTLWKLEGGRASSPCFSFFPP